MIAFASEPAPTVEKHSNYGSGLAREHGLSDLIDQKVWPRFRYTACSLASFSP